MSIVEGVALSGQETPKWKNGIERARQQDNEPYLRYGTP